jgi:hypothetical protein
MKPAAVLCALILLPALAPAQEWPSSEGAAEMLAGLPARAEAVDALSQVAIYDRDTLADYLPEPDRYFEFDYEWTATAQFRRKPVTVSVEIYSFATPLDAFGAFSLERDPLTTEDLLALPGLDTRVSAFWTDSGQLHVWQGPLYLRIVPTTALKSPRPELSLDLAAALLTQWPPPGEAPAIFAIPPARDLIPASVKYRRRNVLGQMNLRDALTATYGRIEREGKSDTLDVGMELVLFDGGDLNGARQVASVLTAYLVHQTTVRQLGALGDAAYALRHPEYGLAYVMRQSRYVAMLYQVKSPASAEALLRELGTSIRRAEAPPVE